MQESRKFSGKKSASWMGNLDQITFLAGETTIAKVKDMN